MRAMLLVGIGGMGGAMLRYLTGALIAHSSLPSRFPWGTLAVNVLGCLLAGVAAALFERLSDWNTESRLLVITGVLGGFTTFSAFGLETLTLLRSGSIALATLNVLTNVVLSLLAVSAGFQLGSGGWRSV